MIDENHSPTLPTIVGSVHLRSQVANQFNPVRRIA
jgi:hypothetical protein